MRFGRRIGLSFACAVVLAGLLHNAHAQNWPQKPVHLIVGFPPGASTDLFARMLGQELTKTWGQSVVVDNKGGANGIIATSELAKAAPDGSVLMFTISSHVTNALYYKQLPYNIERDFTPVVLVTRTPWVLIVAPEVPANNVRELIALAKSKPGQLNYGSAGDGSAPHLTTELFSLMAGISMTHVPYKGSGPAMLDLLGGRLSVMFATVPTLQGYLAQKKIKALGISMTKRLATLPDVPTISEAGVPGFEADVWFGVIAPAGLPPAIARKIAVDTTHVIRQANFVAALAAQSGEPIGGTPDEFAALLRADYLKWQRTFKDARIKTE